MKPWTKEEIEMLQQLVKTMDRKSIAERLGRSEKAVTWRMCKLGLKGKVYIAGKNPWNGEEKDRLRILAETKDRRGIAKDLGRSDSSVSVMMARLGIRSSVKQSSDRQKDWTLEEEKQLEGYIDQKFSQKAIMRLMCRSRSSIQHKMYSMDLSSKRMWSSSEVMMLKNLLETKTRPEIASFLDRSIKSIEKKMVDLGLKTVNKIPNNPDEWTSEEDALIKKKYKDMTNEELGDGLGRSAYAVSHRISSLALEDRGREYLRKQINIPRHSEDLAWFLGCIASDGWVDPDGYVGMSVCDIEFRNRLAMIGTQLFSIVPSYTERDERIEGRSIWRRLYGVVYCSRMLLDFVGNMRKDCWFDTVQDNFSWILDDEKYLWSFISAYFDADGHVSSKRSHINIACLPEGGRSMLKRMFDLVRITYREDSWTMPNDNLKVVLVINTFDSRRRFAQNIVSCIPRKIKGLEAFR